MADERALEALRAGSAAWLRFRAAVPSPDIDLIGADLTGARLTEANLIGTNLSYANFAGADLTRADLINADLTGANLTEANLTGANLTEANLTGARLTEANLTGARLTEANLTGANLTEANLPGAHVLGANLTRVNLTYANLTRAYLINTNLTGADLTGAIFDGEFVSGLRVSSDTRSTQGLDVGGFLIGNRPLGTSGTDVPASGSVRIGIPQLRGGMDPGELVRLSDAIAVIAELSQRVGVELRQRMLSEDDGGGGTSVLTATAGDEFGPIVVRRIQYGSPYFQELWDAAGPYLAGGGAGMAATTAAVVAKRARDGAQDAGRVWSLMLTLARKSERDEYFAARIARAKANTAEELSRKARAEADTAEHESRRDKASATSDSVPEVAEPELDILRLAATPTRTELEQRLHQSELATLASRAELNRIAGILAPFLAGAVEVSRQSEPA
ncbi:MULTISPECIES: pentapeptide repeat-containing protein [unclassified Rhodococcus (in: high G+C Gram-positive bacteria)]|uniref:pentapeptide repeat-containing protein n=1 Tax=unclassified Rhodococcus (in: high G+C Gram-positive bacteria) TaxID=192944 RepID=UPI00211AD438|nr:MULTISPECIES: pentapeptide repeat-containing protein [unclassified Rhodococcus (in: high G+C Gram-positive bacteria)]